MNRAFRLLEGLEESFQQSGRSECEEVSAMKIDVVFPDFDSNERSCLAPAFPDLDGDVDVVRPNMSWSRNHAVLKDVASRLAAGSV